jgi:endonuclease/exonuclease/phosphatase family metal-dependent hydrolase
MQETFLKPYLEKGEEFIPPQDMPRAVLTTIFSFAGKEISFLNCHLAWGPHSKDEPHKVEQGKKLSEYVKSLTTPFVLTGDFNVDKDSQIVQWLEVVGENLVTKNGITNTLNPHTHAAKQLFPPGLGVDFAFVSKNISVTDFHLVDTPDLSDHLGLSLTIDV